MRETGTQGRNVHPKFLSSLGLVTGPRQRLPQGMQIDKLPRRRGVHGSLLLRPGVPRERTPVDMLKLVGQRRATLSLQQSAIHQDQPPRPVTLSADTPRQGHETDGPAGQSSQLAPGVMHPYECNRTTVLIHPATVTRTSD